MDNGNLKLALYPSYNFDDATLRSGANREGRSLYFPIIVSKTLGLFTFVVNAGVTKNFDNTEKRQNFASLAGGFAVSETFRVIGEFTSAVDDEYRRNDLRIGAVREIFPNEKSQYETGLFGSVAESVGPTEDGKTHITLLIGFDFAKKPSGGEPEDPAVIQSSKTHL